MIVLSYIPPSIVSFMLSFVMPKPKLVNDPYAIISRFAFNEGKVG